MTKPVKKSVASVIKHEIGCLEISIARMDTQLSWTPPLREEDCLVCTAIKLDCIGRKKDLETALKVIKKFGDVLL